MEIENPDIFISRRKSEHLRIVSEKDVLHRQSTLLGDVRLIHQALPEIDPEDVNISSELFGKKLAAPFIITSMTGGAEFARKLNEGLAQAAAGQSIAFAVGSQRIMLRHPEMTADFAVRKFIPEGVLFGNIGAVQLDEYSPKIIAEMIKTIEADGVCVHLNIAQELMQIEGHRHFRGMADNIARLVDAMNGKIIVKETGAGLSPESIQKLSAIGVTHIDVSGAGGTSWTKVEMHRATDKLLRQTADAFSNWGIPTAFSVIAGRKQLGESGFIIASGGISNGLDAARAISLGADMAGFARPVLMAFLEKGIEGANEFIKQVKHELATAMLLVGAKNIKTLQLAPRIYTGQLRHWLKAYNWLDKAKE